MDYFHWIEASDSVAMTGVSDYRIIPHGPVPADENVHIRQRFSVSESIASRHFLIHSEDLEDPASPKLEIQWWNGQRFFLIDERDVVIYPSPPSEEATPFLNPLLLPLQTFIHWYDEGQADTVAALSKRYASSLSFKAYCAACLEPGATPLRHLYRDVHDPTKTMDITSIELGGMALPTDITVQDGHELGTITLQW